ncbi:MAG TPA: Na/Pi symporter, partial [Bacilli bacterium]|nr:Na/Pi symporter [Bacilli bacterium]
MNTLSIFSLTENNLFSIILFAIGGLGLFLFGINLMSESLKKLAGGKLKILIQKTTSNTFKAILVGIAITVAIQSSSATTVIVVGLISAGLMTLTAGIGVMLGANIGTTITAFIIGIGVADYALPIIFIGAFLVVFINKRRWVLTGKTILGFGLLFLGLEFMGTGLKELATFPFFINIIATLSSHWILGLFTGISLTAI